MTAMAGAVVDVYLALGSRYSYLASTQFDFVAIETGATFHWIPIASPDLFEGRRSPFTMPPVSPVYDWPYRYDDAKAWAEFYSVPFREPMYRLSFDQALLVRAALAAGRGDMRNKMMKRLFAAVFIDDRKQIDLDVCIDCAEEIGWKRHDFRRALNDPTVETERLAIAERARSLGVFGVPYFIAGGRAFFGNDRLPLLQYHLMTMPPPDLAKASDVAMLADLAKLAGSSRLAGKPEEAVKPIR
jgi:2-hydroxychromene-2-carboxylate isomerase